MTGEHTSDKLSKHKHSTMPGVGVSAFPYFHDEVLLKMPLQSTFFVKKAAIFLDGDISIGVRIFEVFLHFYRDVFFRISISISQHY